MSKTCKICGHSIAGAFMSAKGSHYHPDCYTGPLKDVETVTAQTKIKVKPKGDLPQFDGTPPESDEEKERILKENVVDTLDGDHSTQRNDD